MTETLTRYIVRNANGTYRGHSRYATGALKNAKCYVREADAKRNARRHRGPDATVIPVTFSFEVLYGKR